MNNQARNRVISMRVSAREAGEGNLPDSASKMPECFWNPLAYLSGRKWKGAGEGSEYLLAVLLGRDWPREPQGSGGSQASLRQYLRSILRLAVFEIAAG